MSAVSLVFDAQHRLLRFMLVTVRSRNLAKSHRSRDKTRFVRCVFSFGRTTSVDIPMERAWALLQPRINPISPGLAGAGTKRDVSDVSLILDARTRLSLVVTLTLYHI